jgi:hypothetical protein
MRYEPAGVVAVADRWLVGDCRTAEPACDFTSDVQIVTEFLSSEEANQCMWDQFRGVG